MTRWILLSVVSALCLMGCAHPERIKTVSKEQEARLVNFRTALEDYKEARLRKGVLTETGSFSTQIARCAQTPANCENKRPKILLDEAGEYLARGQGEARREIREVPGVTPR